MTFDEFDALYEVHANLCKAIQNIPALNRRDAEWLADRLLETVIDHPRRDSSLPSRSRDAWWLTLAPAHARLTEQMAAATLDHVDLAQVLTTIEATP
jgi:hypothetical protein